MEMVEIYNQPCGALADLKSESVDVVITSPPYNTKHPYCEYSDDLPVDEYFGLLFNLIRGLDRILKPDGYIIFDVADAIFWRDAIWFAPAFFDVQFANCQLRRFATNTYFANSTQLRSSLDDRMCLPKGCLGHSQTQVVLTFCRMSHSPLIAPSLAPEYDFDDRDDEAFWPQSLVTDYYREFNLKGKIVLDPFMGKGLIGSPIIRNGGRFIGYDVSPICCRHARSSLSK